MNERFTKHSIETNKPIFFYYYRSSGKNIVHLVEEETGKKLRCFHLLENEKIDIKNLAIIKAIQQKNVDIQTHIYAPVLNSLKVDGHPILSWEDLFTTAK